VTRPAQVATPKSIIRDRALSLGFDAVAFAPAELGKESRAALSDFLANGFHGDMGWLADRAAQRSSPKTLWQEAKTIIAVGINYGPSGDPLHILEKPERGAISVYAQGRDYHDVLKKKLRVLARYVADEFDSDVKLFVDTAPVMEKPLAQKAGIGWQGKHTNLVSRDWGSWLFLGEIYTTLLLEPDNPETDHCGGCSRCLTACPTNAFPAPYKLDARRCISYLTIEHRGPVPLEFRTAIGNRIYGCDDCLAVCPWNKFASPGQHEELNPRLELTLPRLSDLATLDDASFRSVFSGSPVKRLGRDRFVRNVLIAIGNSGEVALAASAENLICDVSPVVRGTAVWALSQLLPPDAFHKLKAEHLPTEKDPDVRLEWEHTS
jgi:epoxyqueuosine reductase